MRLYNTLTRDKQDLKPLGEEVLMYVCGVTTYDHIHLGHALSSIIFDVLHRYLEYRGYKVRRVQNFTDVDDKIINRARERGVSAEELAEEHVQCALEDMDSLNVRRATVHPRASQEIPQILGMISTLLDQGAAYEAGGSVYFRVSADKDYGKLSRRAVDEMLEGTRFDVEPGKEAAADFALWKASKPGEPMWDSPWGKGRPGWHIECSAMALHHLGKQIDIHGGGLDLIFPHHENELAQSETALGVEPFVQIWMHNNMVRAPGNERMGKSLGNAVNVRDVIKRHTADAIRMWALQSHYRSPIVLAPDSIDKAEQSLRSIRAAHGITPHHSEEEKLDPAPFKEGFIEFMDDDLNTPRAVAIIFDLARAINREHSEGKDVTGAQAVLTELTCVLGLTLEEPERESQSGDMPEDEIEKLIAARATARKERRFADADAVRDQLQAAGIAISDGPQGTTWTRV
jgi:cysteinyl-tRNA synthetase